MRHAPIVGNIYQQRVDDKTSFDVQIVKIFAPIYIKLKLFVKVRNLETNFEYVIPYVNLIEK